MAIDDAVLRVCAEPYAFHSSGEDEVRVELDDGGRLVN
jgi:hypothetical protein